MGDDIQEIEQIEQAVLARVQEEKDLYKLDVPKSNGRLTSQFIDQALLANELGDGLLYAKVNHQSFTYNNTAAEWLKWQGHNWYRDIMQESLAAVERVVEKLLDEIDGINKDIADGVKNKNQDKVKELEKKRERLFKRIFRLRTDQGRNAMLKFSRTCDRPLAIKGDELNRNPWLLGCKNGVLDLRTGYFRPGRIGDYISKSSPVEWHGLHEKCEYAEEWLNEIFDNDQDLISFVQRVFGYAITGLNREHIFIVLHGKGRNGKGTLVETLSYILGDLAAPIQSEMLLDQGRSRSSAGPSPDIMALFGLRIAFASETDDGRRFSPSRVKWLSGGDTLVGRYPHDKHEISFEPTHTLILLTNHKPGAPPNDFAFWERLYLIPFPFSFVDREPIASNERPIKKGITEKLKQEGPGILAWLVRGCLEYQRIGISPPPRIFEERKKYRADEDRIAEFIEDYCKLDEHAETQASLLYDAYSDWFIENVSKKGITQTRFGRLISDKFTKIKKNGNNYYQGISLVKTPPKPDSGTRGG